MSLLQTQYNRFWSEAISKIRAGNVELDPVLASGAPDRRRGLTLIARPSPTVRRNVAGFLAELRRLEPEQHYYTASEFHVTVLSLFTATVDYKPFFVQQERYLSAVAAALKGAGPIQLNFEGVTVSPGTVMVQGFVVQDALNRLREKLRHELRLRGLGAGLDQRYRLETAHLTVVRFRAPLRDGERFAAALQQARRRPFGRALIERLQLVENDWYMSHQVTKVVKRYQLARRST